ncbi:MAG: MaoC family dehydratase [Flavobacteriaceae bacterium]
MAIARQAVPCFYEDFEVGQKFDTLGRTITEGDLMQFAGMTGDNAALHTDEAYSSASVYGGRLVHGMLTVSIAMGLIGRTLVFEGTGVAILSIDKISFLRPVRIGDTIRARFAITSLRPTKKSDRGVVVREVSVFNQNEEAVAEFSVTGLVLSRDAKGIS